jgi:type I protein arginine methyltransferase
MYTLSDYGMMIADGERCGAYAKAIAKAVRPVDSVLEIGCGPGVFAMLACKAGARKVYAIESEDVLQFAKELAAANGLADCIEFIQSDSRKVELPERVNVIVSDFRGVLPLYRHAIQTVEDAQRRFLAPDGVLIPQRDTLKAAVVDATEYYCRLTTPWRSVAGMELSATLPFILNTSYSVQFKREQLLTDAQSWGVLDYMKGAETRACAELSFEIVRPGTAHGICVWFEAQLSDEVGYSTGPGATKNSVYGQMLFPWLAAVPIEQGQQIQVRLHADLVGNDYVWQWETKIPANRFGPERHFKQSTFYGEHFSPASLRRRAADFVPKLSEAGEADRWLLQAVDGKSSLQEIAQRAAQRYPKIFRRWEDALRRAADLAAEFSR